MSEDMMDDAAKKKILTRLKTIKGHIAGIEKMIESEKCCKDVLIQISAIESSIHKVGLLIMEEHAMRCVLEDEEMDKEKMEEMIKLLLSFSK